MATTERLAIQATAAGGSLLKAKHTDAMYIGGGDALQAMFINSIVPSSPSVGVLMITPLIKPGRVGNKPVAWSA